MKFVFCFISAAALWAAQKPEEPQPRYVDPDGNARAPSDAVLLFNGRDMSGWVTKDGNAAGCHVKDAVMTCVSGSGDLYSTAKFRSAQIHLEFALPSMPEHKGQMRGNSGVYLHGKYEIQILDSFGNPTYPKGALGAIYGQAPPLVNAARRPEQWQTYDIIFHAPRCGPEGRIVSRATVTVLLNGVLVQDHVEIQDTSAAAREGACTPGPLMLQDHSGFKNAPVTKQRFRNVWFRPLE